jgi:hypothetical protein
MRIKMEVNPMWNVSSRLDKDVLESLYEKFVAIAEDPDIDYYSHRELVAAAGHFLGWIVLNIDCKDCRKNTKARITAGLKFLYRKADEEAPPKPAGSNTEHLH